MFESVFAQIKKYNSIVIYGHIDPDGDCFGSQVALKEALTSEFPDKNIYIVGSGLPRFFKLFGKPDIIDEQTIKDSLAIILDGNDIDRMEDKRVVLSKAFTKIDHHIEVVKFERGPYVTDANATSTCELIYKFIKENNLPLTEKAANALYLGILTDTGRFNFVNDFVSIFHIVSDLCANGAKPPIINKALNVTTLNELGLKGYILTNYVKTESGILYILLDKEILNKYHIPASKAHQFVNLLSNVEGCNVWLLGLDSDTLGYHYELRSSGIDIHHVVAKYGGGGHACACGYSTKTFDQDNFNDMIASLEKCLKENK